MNILLKQAEARQLQSRAPGTQLNRDSTIKEYILFSYRFKVNPLNPNIEIILSYIEFLANKKLSPNTIENKISHIRSYLKCAKVNSDILYDDLIQNALEAISRTTNYKSQAKEPVPIEIVKNVIINIQSDYLGCNLKAALLLIMYGGYRQSEVLPPFSSKFDKDKHLTRGDVVVQNNQVTLIQKHGKNMQQFHKLRSSTFNRSPDINFCVVHAIETVLHIKHTVHPEQPMFMYQQGAPIGCNILKATWERVLQKLKIHPKKYSLHSIRKQVCTTAYNNGASEMDIQSFGCWSSRAHRNYIRTNADKKINNILIHQINN